jgi:AcrR family transcriptional regulator
MDKTTSRRERKKRETRQKLLECAWQQFLAQGYDETTVKAITEAADVAKGTFFNYFATKETLLDELALWRLDLLGHRVRSESGAPAAIDRIKRLICAIADEFFPQGDLPRHLLLARISAPIKHKSAHRLGSMTRELVEQGQQSGEIRADLDAELIARLLMTSVFYHFMRVHPDDGPSSLEHARRNATEQELDTQHRRYLEAKLIESVDKLMDGLGGPDRRQR